MNNTDALNEVRHLVVNMRREPFDVYIGRNGRGFSACFGNPFPIVEGDPNATRQAVVSKMETLLLEGQTTQAQEMRASLHRLIGKKVGCFCSPNLCHGHPLVHHANSLRPGEALPLGGKVARLTAPWVEIVAKDEAAQAKTPTLNSSLVTDLFVGFSRYPLPGKPNLEMSSHGDKRFSALYARLKDGRSIEEAYQLDVKGYRAHGNDWRIGKGKPPLLKVDLWPAYKSLWATWVDENPAVFADLARKAQNSTLTDKFASSPISQARALAELLSERLGWRLDSGTKPVESLARSSPSQNAAAKPVAPKPQDVSPQGDLFGNPVDEPTTRPRLRP